MLVDQENDEAYIPLNAVFENQTAFLEVMPVFSSLPLSLYVSTHCLSLHAWLLSPFFLMFVYPGSLFGALSCLASTAIAGGICKDRGISL